MVRGPGGPDLLSSRAVTELSDNAQHVLRSLEEQPTHNTPTLIADGPVTPDELDADQIHEALDELVEAGLVKKRPTGWKLAS